MISVIIPVYNTEEYLPQCLDSLIAQTYRNLEIICVNDGSTDESLNVLSRYAEKDARVTVLSQKNSGVSAARNAGIRAAKGDYISFIDSDDELETDMYEILLNLMKAHEADIAHCSYRKIHANGTVKEIGGTGELLIQSSDEVGICFLTGQRFTGSLWNKLFRREILDGVWFDESLKINEDLLFCAMAFQQAEKIVFLDAAKYHYFERINSACARTQAIRKKRDAADAMKKILAIYKSTPVEAYAAERYFYCLTDLYRAYLFDGIRKNRQRLEQLQQQMNEVEPHCQKHSMRLKANYAFMRCCPVAYKLIYSVYDRIRKPNWDI